MNSSIEIFDKVLADAMAIKDKGNFLPDCSTKEGYEASKRFVLDVTTPARTALASAHKEAKAYWLEGGRLVDSKKKELEEMLLEVEAPHKAAYKAVDEEVKRIKAEKEARVQNGIDSLKSYVEKAFNQSSEVISSLIDECQDFDCDPEIYQAQADFIVKLHGETMEKLTEALSNALRFEDMARKQAEIDAAHAKMLAEQAEQERKVREAEQREQMRIEAEQRAAAQIEQERQNRIYAEEQAKLQAEQAEQRAKQQAEQAEARRLADIESAKQQEIARQAAEAARAKAEAEAREADKNHRATINNQAMDCFIAGGLPEEFAKLAVKLLASKKIAHAQINY